MESIPNKTQIGPPNPSNPKPLYSDQKPKQITQPSLANINIKHPVNITRSPESKKCGNYPAPATGPNKPVARYPVQEGPQQPTNSVSQESSCINISTNTSSNNKCDMKQERIRI